MPKRWLVGGVAVAAFAAGTLVTSRMPVVQAQNGSSASGYPAVPGQIGAMDIYGPYDVAEGWPKDLSTLPGNEKWTFGAGQGVFAESPNRVIYIQRGQLPVLPQGARGGTPLPQVGPNLVFPVAGIWRNATQASPPGALFRQGTQTAGDDSDAGTPGVDYLWENNIVIFDRAGNIVETWKQWD